MYSIKDCYKLYNYSLCLDKKIEERKKKKSFLLEQNSVDTEGLWKKTKKVLCTTFIVQSCRKLLLLILKIN